MQASHREDARPRLVVVEVGHRTGHPIPMEPALPIDSAAGSRVCWAMLACDWHLRPFLAGSVIVAAQVSAACSGETRDSNVGSSDLVGDWMAVRSESATYTGELGNGLVYFMFLDASTLCIAVCSPFPTNPAIACASDYRCECQPYTLQGGVMTTAENTVVVSFEEAGEVFVGQATVRDAPVKNWYRRAPLLPEGAIQCRASGM